MTVEKRQPVRRRPGWWLAAVAVGLCLLVIVLQQLAPFAPRLHGSLRSLFRQLVHAAPMAFEIALVGLLSIDPRRATPTDDEAGASVD